ncbi:MAG: hypothetical protein RLZZ08_993 [Pseudomonadota bacterium]|jgi:two-component sensor histidine kinase
MYFRRMDKGNIARYPALSGVILADRPPLVALGWSILAVACGFFLRLAIDGGAYGVPFTTFYPAVVLTALLLGWFWGALVSVASAMVANGWLMEKPLLRSFSAHDMVLAGLFLLSCAALVATAEFARRMVRQLEAAKEREELLNSELVHRVKNMLATVGAIASMTARHSDPADFQRALAGRMDALQRATDMLGTGGAPVRDLKQLVDNAIAPFRSADNFTVTGPGCDVPRAACIPLSLALHELCTNALKYGALSVPGGQVELRWALDDAEPSLIRLCWQESGGPPVAAPTRAGLGTQLLTRQRELADAVLDYAPQGLICTLTVVGATASVVDDQGLAALTSE